MTPGYKFVPEYQDVIFNNLKERYPLIQVLIGPRQVGKTTVAKIVHSKWSGPKTMISADSPSPPNAEWLRFHWQQARQKGEGSLLIVDEIQKIFGWSEVIKELFDQDRNQRDIKILLLGSSSLNIQKGLSESLAGRFELIRAHHWSFLDCKKAFEWDFTTYLKFGGYPGAQRFFADEERWRNYILNSIIEPVLSKDILGQVRIHKPALFKQCFELILNYPAQEISLQKLLGQLQDRGNAETVKHYLELFEKCFLIKLLYKYTGSQMATRASSPKIVILNTALVNAYHVFKKLEVDPTWYGHVFESLVGAQLSTIPNCQLYYWREQNREVDFVLQTPEGLLALEIKSGVKQTSSAGIQEFAKKYPKAKCEIWDHERCLSFLNDPSKIF